MFMKKKILFIDDDEIILKSFEALLKHLNYDITVCSNGLEGYSLAKDNDYSLIITDYKMPNMNGIDLIKKIKLLDKKIEFILVSGFLTDEILQEAHNVGVMTIMDKPFDISKIVTIMEYL